MNPQTKRQIVDIFSSLVGMSIFIILLIVGFVFFSYLLIIGATIGLVLFGIAYLRAKLLAHKMRKQRQNSQHRQGRIIDHEK